MVAPKSEEIFTISGSGGKQRQERYISPRLMILAAQLKAMSICKTRDLMQQEANVMKTKTSTKRHNLTRIAMYCSIMYSGATIGAESVEYDPTFLMGGNASSIDVSRYSDGNPTLPGVYDVSIYVNEQPVANLEIPLSRSPIKRMLKPVLP